MKSKKARLPRKIKKAYKLNKLPNSGKKAISTLLIRMRYKPVKGAFWRPMVVFPLYTKHDWPHFELPKPPTH